MDEVIELFREDRRALVVVGVILLGMFILLRPWRYIGGWTWAIAAALAIGELAAFAPTYALVSAGLAVLYVLTRSVSRAIDRRKLGG